MQVESLDHLFSLLWQKIDPETGKTVSQHENLTSLRDFSDKTRVQRQESSLLLQLFMDRRSAIKSSSYDTLLKSIAANQAKGTGSAVPIVPQMHLEEAEQAELPDKERLQDIVTYDLVPELESYMLAIDKRLHQSLDEFDDSMG